MIEKVASYLKRIFDTVTLRIKIFFLYIKHLFALKTLQVSNVGVTDLFVIEGTEVELLWNVKGCHKIKIEGLITVTGDVSGMKFIFHEALSPLTIKFYGVRKKVKKVIRIESTTVNILTDFHAPIHIPQIEKVPLSEEVLEHKFTGKELTIRTTTPLKLNKNLSQPLIIHHQPFKQANYEEGFL